MKLLSILTALMLLPVYALPAQQVDHAELKWMRDSEEYQHLVRQIYRTAWRGVEAQRRGLPDGTDWAVVLDVDETVLDNSVYQLELAAYGTAFDTTSWNAFVRREASPAVPGVAGFLQAVREAGGHVAFITNRHEWTREETRRNLAHLALWRDDDRLCLRTVDPAYTKRVRRSEVLTGQGPCAWTGRPMRVLAFIGDQMGDMPAPDEVPHRVFGDNLFLIPNPSYGEWERAVTRKPGG